jgi:signal transduction histidine kinase/PleD family two-component response regulator
VRPTAPLRGRVLVVGEEGSTSLWLEKLSSRGFYCAVAASAEAVLSLAQQLQPEAILVVGAGILEREALQAIRQSAGLRQLPVLADLTGGHSEALRRMDFDFDDRIHSEDELTVRLEAALRAKRLAERDAIVQLRMEALLEITQAATSSLELEEILRIALEKLSRVIVNDRCSVVLVEGANTRQAQVVASAENPSVPSLELDLARYPELRKALETRQPVHIEDASRDPLMAEVRSHIAPLGVRSILVQPLICQEDLVGALFLRLSRADGSFGRHEQEFARAAAAALANSVRNARLHTALKRKRDDLELAYVDRYRELTEANRRLKELNRIKDEIIAVVSHDLRAPLQVLLGHGRLLLDGEPSPPQKASLEAIVRQGKKILDLVESLLERGKGDQARFSLEPARVDVAELCNQAAEELEILAAERGVVLRPETPESLMVVGDEVKLRQVLQNLMTNAIQHAKPSGTVTIRCQRLRRPDGDAVRVVVQDDGPGIPENQLHVVFDRYRHGPGGTGLGLTICKEFVELHGGEIWAENLSSGGCAVTFTLPLSSSQEIEAVGPISAPIGELPRVLVVEDEPEVAAVVCEILRSRYRVELARDGAEGVAKARGLHPDLIVMDVFLPKLDGLDAAAALKSSSDTTDIPVILLSAHQGVADKVRALNLGAVDYMSKPFQALELLGRAARAIELCNTQKELQRSTALLRKTGSDPETGMFDRAGLLNRLGHELSRSQRYRRPLSMAVLVPDRAAAKERIRECAMMIRERIRTPDFIAHLGDGVFAVVLPESNAAGAHGICSRLTTELEDATGLTFRTSSADVGRDGPKPEMLLEELLAAVRQ